MTRAPSASRLAACCACSRTPKGDAHRSALADEPDLRDRARPRDPRLRRLARGDGLGRRAGRGRQCPVIACPCAMGLALPTACSWQPVARPRSGSCSAAARRRAPRPTCVLDKTGTVTFGRPKVVRFELAPGVEVDRAALLADAAAIEPRRAPLARAVAAMPGRRTDGDTGRRYRALRGSVWSYVHGGVTTRIGSALLAAGAEVPDDGRRRSAGRPR